MTEKVKKKEKLLTVADCVRALGVSRQRVHQHIKAGRLKVCAREGRLVLIDPAEFQRFVSQLKQRRKQTKTNRKRKVGTATNRSTS